MSSNPSPARAAALSFIFPGLGQVYGGAVVRGLLWALPSALLVFAALVTLSSGLGGLVGLFTRSDTLLALVVLWIAVGFYHLAAMFDAYGLAQRQTLESRSGNAGTVALSVLIVLTLLVHGVPSAAGLWLNDYQNRHFGGQDDIVPPFIEEPEPTPSPTPTASPTASPSPSPSPTPTPTTTAGGTPTPGGSPTPTPPPTPTPSPTPRGTFPPINAAWAADGRLNVLLLGTDAGPGRRGGRTDTMILLSVEIMTGKAALFGFARNLYNVPLPEDAQGNPVNNRIFIDPFYQGGSPGLLTNLWQRAYESANNYYTPQGACPAEMANREQCLREARAWRATTGAIQNLAGVQVDGVIAVNLTAFKDLVDAVGGVWVNVPSRVTDRPQCRIVNGRRVCTRYLAEDGETILDIDIRAGCQWFDGRWALAYARSRHGDSDYQRMRRQQIVLQAVRRQFDPIAMLPQVPALLNVAASNLYTTFPHDQFALLAEVARRVDADRLYQVRFGGPPGSRYPSGLTSSGIRDIRQRVRNIFSEPEPEPPPRQQRERCPAPGQTPAPLPTPYDGPWPPPVN